MEILIITLSLAAAILVGGMAKQRKNVEIASVAAGIVSFAASISIALRVSASGTYAPSAFFSIDALGAIVILIISCVGLAATAYSVPYLRAETEKHIIGFKRVRQYFMLLNLFIAAMYVAVAASSPVLAWIAIEMTTLSTVFLISFYNKPASMEAAWKYLIINSIGLLLGFFGALLYFTSTNALGDGLVSWQSLLVNASHLDPLIVKIAFIFVLVGYGTKVGLAPMHTWLPDAHSKAPVPVSALLSGVLLNVAFVIILRFKYVTDASIGPAFAQNLLMTLGILSIFIASLIILTQKNYKRLLAYSSVENMGIIALGFGFGGLGVFAAILHMIYHSLLKSALFLSSGTIFLKFSSTKIARIRGVMTALPVTGILFFVGFFAITGAPPFGVFYTKLSILTAGIASHPVIAIAALAFMALVFVGFFQHATAMLFGDKPEEIETGERSVWLIVPPLVLLVIAFGLSLHVPQFMYGLINEIASK